MNFRGCIDVSVALTYDKYMVQNENLNLCMQLRLIKIATVYSGVNLNNFFFLDNLITSMTWYNGEKGE